MHKCEYCNIILDKSVRFCPKCGKEVSPGDGKKQMPKLEVGVYLTSANLHRIRKEWDEAVADATEALRLDPGNADIASLLGAIYQERGMLEDAVIWFQMALEMNPDSASDRARLKEVKTRMSEVSAGAKPADHFRIFEKRTRVWAGAMAAMFIVVVVLALMLAFGRHDQGDVTGGVKYDRGVESSTTVPSRESAAPPIISSGTAARQPVHSEAKVAPSSSSGNSTLRTPAEVKISESVSQAEGIGSAKVDDVIADPRQNIATVTHSIPAGTLSKSAVVSAAGAVARAAFAANSEIKFVTARCLVIPGGSSTTQIAFVGDISRQAMEALGANATADQIQASFTGQWWNPQIK
ncbi:MAG: tetratricopeptide repeat protein [Armatimonadota bacterium]